MTDEFIDYFDLLGLTPDASDKDVDRAYRAKIKEHHPDKHEDDDEAVERAKRLNEARDTLKDPAKRQAYHAKRLLHSFIKRTNETRISPNQSRPTANFQSAASPVAQPNTTPVMWTPPPPPPPYAPSFVNQAPAPEPSGLREILAATLVVAAGLGIFAFFSSPRNSYDRNGGRYRGPDGKFRAGRRG
ncbi:MAG: J domain-containing protein [Enhygromyxa sp.]